MREQVIKRLENIKAEENNYPKQTMRWRNFMHQNTHISEVNPEALPDNELIDLLERVAVRRNKQM